MSVCTKFQLTSWSRSCWKVCGSGGVVGWGGVGNTWLLCLTPTLVILELHWVELSCVGFWQNSVFGSGLTEFEFQNSVSGSGLTEFKFKNSVSGSGWQNLNSFVPYSPSYKIWLLIAKISFNFGFNPNWSWVEPYIQLFQSHTWPPGMAVLHWNKLT